MRQILLLSVNGFTLQKLFLLTSLLVCFFTSAEETSPISTARAWLTLVDSGEYHESWQQADQVFQNTTPKARWQTALNQIRVPLGRVMSRTYFGTAEYSSLPGLPNGEYLVVKFQTEFMNKEAAVETLSLSKAADGWHPLGYLIN